MGIFAFFGQREPKPVQFFASDLFVIEDEQSVDKYHKYPKGHYMLAEKFGDDQFRIWEVHWSPKYWLTGQSLRYADDPKIVSNAEEALTAIQNFNAERRKVTNPYLRIFKPDTKEWKQMVSVYINGKNLGQPHSLAEAAACFRVSLQPQARTQVSTPALTA